MLILIVLTLAILYVAFIMGYYLPKIHSNLKVLSLYLEDTLFKPKKIPKKEARENKRIEKENEKLRQGREKAFLKEVEAYNEHFDGEI